MGVRSDLITFKKLSTLSPFFVNNFKLLFVTICLLTLCCYLWWTIRDRHFSMAMYSRNTNLQIFLSLYDKLSTDHLSTSNELSKVYVTDFMANLIFLWKEKYYGIVFLLISDVISTREFSQSFCQKICSIVTMFSSANPQCLSYLLLISRMLAIT